MKRFLVFDHYNGDHEFFDTIEEAKDYLKDCVQDEDGVFCEDPELSAIFELHTGIKIEIKEYKEDYESRGEEWPYDNDWDYTAKMHIKPVNQWTNAIEIIAKERQRQIDVEEYDSDHDDQYETCELSQAAACYCLAESLREDVKDTRKGLPIVRYWPWSPEYWKPTPNDRIKELAKAGALIAAEIDRLQRLKG